MAKTDNDTNQYEYTEAEIAKRHKEKAEQVAKLSKSISDVREKAKKDLNSDEERTRMIALVVLLLDETYARVGNRNSVEERGHYGATTWRKKHVKFHGEGATISYTGKSGVDQKRPVTNKKVVKALKDLCEKRKDNDFLFTYESKDRDNSCLLKPSMVNDYLSSFDVTAKDIRGFHANDLMRDELKQIRKDGDNLSDLTKKEREAILEKEFQKALKVVAKKLGHKEVTLRSHYLVPGFEEHYLKEGTPMKDFKKKAMILRVASQYLRR